MSLSFSFASLPLLFLQFYFWLLTIYHHLQDVVQPLSPRISIPFCHRFALIASLTLLYTQITSVSFGGSNFVTTPRQNSTNHREGLPYTPSHLCRYRIPHTLGRANTARQPPQAALLSFTSCHSFNIWSTHTVITEIEPVPRCWLAVSTSRIPLYLSRL